MENCIVCMEKVESVFNNCFCDCKYSCCMECFKKLEKCLYCKVEFDTKGYIEAFKVFDYELSTYEKYKQEMNMNEFLCNVYNNKISQKYRNDINKYDFVIQQLHRDYDIHIRTIKFGKYKGQTFRSLIVNDISYCKWLINNNIIKEEYINEYIKYKILINELIDKKDEERCKNPFRHKHREIREKYKYVLEYNTVLYELNRSFYDLFIFSTKIPISSRILDNIKDNIKEHKYFEARRKEGGYTFH